MVSPLFNRWVRPRLFWCASDLVETKALEKPTMICASASPHEVGRWRSKNRWADHISIVTFGGDDLDPLGEAFGPRAGMIPWRVDNPPAAIFEALVAAKDFPYTEHERDAMGRYLAAVEAVATYAPPGPTWWILSESDQGMGAVRVAKTRGACVALAARGRDLGVAGATLAQRLNVDVAVKDMGATVQ